MTSLIDILIASLPIVLTISSFIMLVISLFIKRKLIFDLIALIALSYSFIVIVLACFSTLAGKHIVYFFGGWPPPLGISYLVDKFSIVFAFIVVLLTFITFIFGIDYLKKEHGAEYYYALLFILNAGMLGILFTNDFFNLFVMLELLGISAYGLVAFRRSIREAVEAAFKYAIISSISTSIYLFAILGFAYGTFGTFNMIDFALKLSNKTLPITWEVLSNVEIASAFFLMLTIIAFTIQIAAVPFHFWLPDAHPEAPSTISAILSGAVIKIGIYVISRLIFTIYNAQTSVANDARLVLLALGSASALYGAILMNVQEDYKRLLAYSSIMNIGTILIGLGLGTKTSLIAALYHVVNHAMAKALLFLTSGSFSYALHERQLNKLKGAGKLMPVTNASLIIGILSIAGMPPFNSFMSKLLLYVGFVEAVSKNPVYIAPLLIDAFSFIVALFAYVRVLITISFEKPSAELKLKEPALMKLSMFMLSALCISLGPLSAWLFVPAVLEPAISDLTDLDSFVEALLSRLPKG